MTRAASHPAKAAALILVAMTLMGLVDTYVPVIAETTGLWQFQVIRTVIALCLLTGCAALFGWRLRPQRWRPVIARSAVISSALIVYFASLAVLPVAEAVAGLFTAPIFVLLMSAALYGHRIGPVRIAAVIAGFAGVLLVLRPEAGGLTWLSAMPVAAGLLYALAMLATREWCEGEGALTLLYGFFAAMGLWGLGGLALLTLISPPVPDGAAGWSVRLWGDMAAEAWLWTLAQALFSLVAVGCITRAYQIGEASYVAVFEYALLVSVVAWGWALFALPPDVWTGTGIALIVVSGTAIALRGRPTPPRPDPLAGTDPPRMAADR